MVHNLQFMGIRSWIGASVIPTNSPQLNSPSSRLLTVCSSRATVVAQTEISHRKPHAAARTRCYWVTHKGNRGNDEAVLHTTPSKRSKLQSSSQHWQIGARLRHFSQLFFSSSSPTVNVHLLINSSLQYFSTGTVQRQLQNNRFTIV